MLTEYLISFVIMIISFLGYPGLLILMALESMIFPLPSELVMPFAGYLVATGEFNLYLAIIFSTLGSLAGSLLSYYAGKHFGKKFVIHFGKYLLLDEEHLNWTEHWFKKHGEKTIFVSRLIPVVRHLISIPAGIGKMNIKKFFLYTFIGATAWNSFLAYLGFLLGKNWALAREYSEYFSITVAVLLFIFGAYFIYRHIKHKLNKN